MGRWMLSLALRPSREGGVSAHTQGVSGQQFSAARLALFYGEVPWSVAKYAGIAPLPMTLLVRTSSARMTV